MTCPMGRFGRHGTPVRYYVALEPDSLRLRQGTSLASKRMKRLAQSFTEWLVGSPACLQPWEKCGYEHGAQLVRLHFEVLD